MADVEKAEPEYVPADYVAPADAAEQTKGGSRWAPVCDWPLAFRDGLNGIPPRSEPRGLHSSGPRSRSYTSPLPTKDNILRILNRLEPNPHPLVVTY